MTKSQPLSPKIILDEYDLNSYGNYKTPVQLIGRYPNPSDVDVSPSLPIFIIFNVDMLISSVTSTSFYVMKNGVIVAGTVESQNARTFSFTPTSDFDGGSEYTVVVREDVRSALGKRFDGATWTFTTLDDVAGKEWTAVTKLSTIPSSIHQTPTGRILIGTSSAKIFYTDDLITFTEASFSIAPNTTFSFSAITSNSAGLLLATERYYTWTSSDDGVNWTRRASKSAGWVLENIDDTNAMLGGGAGRGYASPIKFSDGSVVRTANMEDNTGGNGWVYSLAKIDSNKWIFGTGETGTSHIHRTLNQADSECPKILEAAAAGNNSTYLSTFDAKTVYAWIPETAGTTIRKSIDDGATWSTLKTFDSQLLGRILMVSDSVAIIGHNGSGGKFLRTTDFTTFTEAKTGTQNTNVLYKLSDGSVLAGTDGSVTNLWISTPG
jgi:hypothetical protein